MVEIREVRDRFAVELTFWSDHFVGQDISAIVDFDSVWDCRRTSHGYATSQITGLKAVML